MKKITAIFIFFIALLVAAPVWATQRPGGSVPTITRPPRDRGESMRGKATGMKERLDEMKGLKDKGTDSEPEAEPEDSATDEQKDITSSPDADVRELKSWYEFHRDHLRKVFGGSKVSGGACAGFIYEVKLGIVSIGAGAYVGTGWEVTDNGIEQVDVEKTGGSIKVLNHEFSYDRYDGFSYKVGGAKINSLSDFGKNLFNYKNYTFEIGATVTEPHTATVINGELQIRPNEIIDYVNDAVDSSSGPRPYGGRATSHPVHY